MINKIRKNLDEGLTLVEVLIVASIILVFLLAFYQVHNLYLRAALSNIDKVKAILLSEEGLEGMRFLRDSSWDTNISPLSPGKDYNLVFTSGSWQINDSVVYVDSKFERIIELNNVYRNSSGDIVSSGGTLDENTRLVTSRVSWRHGSATSTESIATYLANTFNN